MTYAIRRRGSPGSAVPWGVSPLIVGHGRQLGTEGLELVVHRWCPFTARSSTRLAHSQWDLVRGWVWDCRTGRVSEPEAADRTPNHPVAPTRRAGRRCR